MTLDTHIDAIQRHLRQHPPDFLLAEAKIGFKPTEPPRQSKRIEPTQRMPAKRRTPKDPWTPEELAAVAKLPMPGQLGRGKPIA